MYTREDESKFMLQHTYYSPYKEGKKGKNILIFSLNIQVKLFDLEYFSTDLS
jgi:hypothetical protein